MKTDWCAAQLQADMMKALANPLRVWLVQALQSGELCVRDLQRQARRPQSTLSRHLALLRRAGIVSARQVGLHVFYHLENPATAHILAAAQELLRADLRRRSRPAPPQKQ